MKKILKCFNRSYQKTSPPRNLLLINWNIQKKKYCNISEKKSNLSLIVCIDKKYGFSKNNEIPWSIKEDSSFFLDVTKKKN